MIPKFLFTLGGDLGTKTISEPEGWNKIIFNLERDTTYWSLIENFELPLIFYASNGRVDGGFSYLDAARTNGLNTLVTLDILVSFDEGSTYETCFLGRIDISTLKEIVFRRKFEAAIVRADLWAQFMAKKSTPVDLLSTTDLYGNTRLGIPYQVINMPSQKIKKLFQGDMSEGGSFFSIGDDYTSATGQYGQFDFDETPLSEISEKINLPIGLNPTIPSGLFIMDEDGTYRIAFRIEVSELILRDGNYNHRDLNIATSFADFFVAINGTEYVTSETTYSTAIHAGISSLLPFVYSTVYEFDQTIQLNKGDEVKFYCKFLANFSCSSGAYSTLIFWGKNNSNAQLVVSHADAGLFNCDLFYRGFDLFAIPSGNPNPSFLNIDADTTRPATTSDTILIHDAGLSITDRILGRDDSFYSSFLGGANSAIYYPTNGCGYLNAITRGLNIRGYSFTEKPFTLSFDDYWQGINPMFNLGLGYEELSTNSPGSTVIRIEEKGYFFNQTPSIYLTGVNNIQVEFDLNLLTKTIEIGFEQWQAESISGIDDPQTKHIYQLLWETFGRDEKQLSKFIAASLAIEQTRRLGVLQSQDWRLDENTFIIALQEQDASIVPETSPPTITQQPEVFSASPSPVTGLNNPETRYNVRHTPARMLQRWIDFYSGQLQSYLSESFKYASGQGNVLMRWTGDTCDTGTLIENQNQSISSNYLFLPVVYSFTHPLTWDDYATIRDNRNHAISFSWIDVDGSTQTKIGFIKKLGYEINKSKATFELWIKA